MPASSWRAWSTASERIWRARSVAASLIAFALRSDWRLISSALRSAASKIARTSALTVVESISPSGAAAPSSRISSSSLQPRLSPPGSRPASGTSLCSL